MKRFLVGVLASVLAVAGFVMPASSAGAEIAPDVDALWDLSVVPDVPNWPDEQSVELGVKFTTSEDITVRGVRFYKGDLNTGTHTGSLWTLDGALLATGTFQNETAEGWQDLVFDAPVSMAAGETLIASYFVPFGYYSAVNNYFETEWVSGPVTALSTAEGGSIDEVNQSAPDGNGVYTYADESTFPEFTFLASNYWVSPLWTVDTTTGDDDDGDDGDDSGDDGDDSDDDGDDDGDGDDSDDDDDDDDDDDGDGWSFWDWLRNLIRSWFERWR